MNKVKNDENIINENIEDCYKERLSTSEQMYLKEIGRYPLLTQEEEHELALKIKEQDSEAKRKFIESNLRLVVFFAKRYVQTGVPLLDLIQAGNIGLMMAVDKFDPKMDFKFSTYAHFWINQTIVRYISQQERIIRLPNQLNFDVYKYKAQVSKLNEKYGSLSNAEISEKLNIPVKKVDKFEKLGQDVLSLQFLVGNKKNLEFGDALESSEPEPEDIVINGTLLKIEIEKALNILKPRERQVVELYYGLNDGVCHTLENIGNQMNLTKERIRQINLSALKKIRNSEFGKSLKEFL